MRLFASFVIAITALLASCGSEPKQVSPEPVSKAEPVRPADESRRFPQTNLVDTKVGEKELMGKSFMPGGTLAHYKKGKVEYDMFVAKLPSATDAAVVLPDWRKALTDAKLVASFGGYFGQDNGRPVFVFAKDVWVAGVAGLPEKDADLQARALASRLN